MPRTKRVPCRIVILDEISWEPEIASKDGDTEFYISRGNDKAMVADVRKLVYDDDADYDDDDDDERSWELVAIAHTPKSTLIEFTSDRGHVATTQIIWL